MLFDRFEKIVVLIDADNAQASKIENVLLDASTYGRIVTKRAYANWTKSCLKPWENEVKRFAIGTIQQFDYVSGKNVTDMALTIDAMDLLYTGDYDCFVIVSSDSDFTTLAIKLHESGVYVIGYGNKSTVESFRNACDEFNYVEDLEENNNVDNSAEEPAGKQSEIVETIDTMENGDNLSKDDRVSTDKDHEIESEDLSIANKETAETQPISLSQLDDLLRIAEDKYSDDDGYVNVASAGHYIKRVRSDFNIKALGYSKLPDYLRQNIDKYDVVERMGKGNAKLIMYKTKRDKE